MSANAKTDIIAVDNLQSLAVLFQQRVKRSPNNLAYQQFNQSTAQWQQFSWQQMADKLRLWQTALAKQSFQPGEKIAILLPNSIEWLLMDQAALSLGLVVVPLYTNDRAENLIYIMQHAEVKLLFLPGQEHWDLLADFLPALTLLTTIVSLQHIQSNNHHHIKLSSLEYWLPKTAATLPVVDITKQQLATIVYTSGTTGKPKGVMLSHANILWNASSGLKTIAVYPHDKLLSFLPLSHTLERTVGYYLPIIAGASVTYARSIPLLADDLVIIRPSLLISVPRIFERVYNKIQTGLKQKSWLARQLFLATVNIGWQRFLYQQHYNRWQLTFLLWPLLNQLVAKKVLEKLGGKMRFAISGGAPLSCQIAQTFIALGLPICQGYGLTETSPVISVNPLENNRVGSVGVALHDVNISIGEQQELLVKSPGVMLGYWKNAKATEQMIDDQHWLHTGDQAELDGKHIYITGRLKEIIVLANGENVPPADLEMAIILEPLIEQVIVIGDNRPFLVALIVVNPSQWAEFCQIYQIANDLVTQAIPPMVEQELLAKIAARMSKFPGYAQIRRCAVLYQAWTTDNGLMTPTLKLCRKKIIAQYKEIIDWLYLGHESYVED